MTKPFAQTCRRFISVLRSRRRKTDPAVQEEPTGARDATFEPTRFECTLI